MLGKQWKEFSTAPLLVRLKLERKRTVQNGAVLKGKQMELILGKYSQNHKKNHTAVGSKQFAETTLTNQRCERNEGSCR